MARYYLFAYGATVFLIQIFDHSAAFDCRDILDDEKGMLEVFQKRTFIEIDTAIFSIVVFKENAYYWENGKFFLHITLNKYWNLKDFRDQVSNKLASHNFHSKR